MSSFWMLHTLRGRLLASGWDSGDLSLEFKNEHPNSPPALFIHCFRFASVTLYAVWHRKQFHAVVVPGARTVKRRKLFRAAGVASFCKKLAAFEAESRLDSSAGNYWVARPSR